MAELEGNLLPAIKADLSYTASEYDRVRAYIVLVHAEVESFVEQRVVAEFAVRHAAWDGAKQPSVVLMGLLAFKSGEWESPIDSLNPPTNPEDSPRWRARDTSARLSACITQQNRSIRTLNHGIRAANVLPMLLPLGFGAGDLDAGLVSDLDAFGSMRGTIAHSAARTTSSVPDPADAKNKVTRIMAGLAALDSAISALP